MIDTISWREIVLKIKYLITLTPILSATLLPLRITAQTNITTAVGLDHIKSYGLTAPPKQTNKSIDKVPIYAEPIESIAMDSLQVYQFVRYERLSEIENKPYWAPRKEHRLADGEWFKVNHDGKSGWLPDNNLMTFSSGFREYELDSFFDVYKHQIAFCLYSSGQYESAISSALTVWERIQPENIWVLRDIKINPIEQGLYMIPKIDSVYSEDRINLNIRISAIGGDVGEIWGSRVVYLFKNDELIFEKQETVSETTSN